MRVHVTHSIDDLARDLAVGSKAVPSKGPRIVAASTKLGLKEAKRLARAKAGPHGKNYYKRLSADHDGLTGEYGPTGTPKTEFVGVGFRSGINLDLPNSADLAGPDLERRARGLLDDIFWPGGDQ